jgi:hypothetical protein
MTATMIHVRTPAPPRELMDAMGAAARNGDDTAFRRAHARYLGWLHDNGHIEDGRPR